MRLTLKLSIFVVLLASCKKDFEIAPSATYFPSYANSYWNYLNENDEIVQIHTTPYKLSYKCGADTYNHVSESSIDLNIENAHYTSNIIRDAAGLSNRYNISDYETSYVGGQILNPYINHCSDVMSENIGDSWNLNSCSQTNNNITIKEVVAKEIISDLASYSTDPFIVVKQFETVCQLAFSADSTVFYEYYAKNIGLVKRIKVSHPQNDTIIILMLQDYDIND